jgi:hypothetical protein
MLGPLGERGDGLVDEQPVLGPLPPGKADAVVAVEAIEVVPPRDRLEHTVDQRRPGDHHALLRRGQHDDPCRALGVRPPLQLAHCDACACVVADVQGAPPVVELLGHEGSGHEAVLHPAEVTLELAVQADLLDEHHLDALQHHLQCDVPRAVRRSEQAALPGGRHF